MMMETEIPSHVRVGWIVGGHVTVGGCVRGRWHVSVHVSVRVEDLRGRLRHVSFHRCVSRWRNVASCRGARSVSSIGGRGGYRRAARRDRRYATSVSILGLGQGQILVSGAHRRVSISGRMKTIRSAGRRCETIRARGRVRESVVTILAEPGVELVARIADSVTIASVTLHGLRHLKILVHDACFCRGLITGTCCTTSRSGCSRAEIRIGRLGSGRDGCETIVGRSGLRCRGVRVGGVITRDGVGRGGGRGGRRREQSFRRRSRNDVSIGHVVIGGQPPVVPW